MHVDLKLYRRVVQAFGLFCFALAAINTVANHAAQDGATYVAAGQLALAGEWGAVYPTMRETPVSAATYAELYCALVPDASQPCRDFLVPFFSPPPMLLIAGLLGAAPTWLGFAALRFAAAACLAWGALRTWDAAVALNPAVGRPLAVGLLALTPLAQNAIELGQSSPWLFAAVMAGWPAARRWPEAARLAGLLVGCALAKLSPALLGLVLVARGERRAAGLLLGGLALGSVLVLLWVPSELWVAQATFSRAFAAWVPAYVNNTSPEAAWYRLGLELLGAPAGVAAFTRLKVAGLLAVSAWLAWRVRDARLWMLAWLVWLVALPVNWQHYNFVGVATLAVLAAPRVRTEAHGWVLAAWLALPSALLMSLREGPTLAAIGGGAWLVGSLVLAVAAVTAPAASTEARAAA